MLFVVNERITTTPEHPFYVAQKGFVKAVNLRAGDILCTVNGEYVIVEQVQHEILESPVTFYNFRVAENHTYYVGRVGVGVHDSKECTISGNDYSGELLKVDNPDPAADALAERIGGKSRVKFSNDPKGREFDAISDQYIGQAKPNIKSYGKQWRNQTKATFEAAKQTGGKAYFQFEGKPVQSVLNKIAEYGRRYNVEYVIDTEPLGITNK